MLYTGTITYDNGEEVYYIGSAALAQTEEVGDSVNDFALNTHPENATSWDYAMRETYWNGLE